MYWTFENWTHNYGQVHNEDCGYCDGAPGTQGTGSNHDGKWLGPFERFADALHASTLDTTPCDHCSPA
jgi:hypothetical protein